MAWVVNEQSKPAYSQLEAWLSLTSSLIGVSSFEFFIIHLDLAKLRANLSQMEVKTGELRNQLSRYLKRVRQTGSTITVMDRNRPIAEIRPYPDAAQDVRSDVWTRRAQLEAQWGKLDEEIDLPERRTNPEKHSNPFD